MKNDKRGSMRLFIVFRDMHCSCSASNRGRVCNDKTYKFIWEPVKSEQSLVFSSHLIGKWFIKIGKTVAFITTNTNIDQLVFGDSFTGY